MMSFAKYNFLKTKRHWGNGKYIQAWKFSKQNSWGKLLRVMINLRHLTNFINTFFQWHHTRIVNFQVRNVQQSFACGLVQESEIPFHSGKNVKFFSTFTNWLTEVWRGFIGRQNITQCSINQKYLNQRKSNQMVKFFWTYFNRFKKRNRIYTKIIYTKYTK